jgi:hypothetical protein
MVLMRGWAGWAESAFFRGGRGYVGRIGDRLDETCVRDWDGNAWNSECFPTVVRLEACKLGD